jgi:two-component system, cell cycle sensor histidine kinase and response regulator CckA
MEDRQGALLVVDDDQKIREMLSLRLKREGHAIVGAASGQEALDLVRTSQIDLVLLDYCLPDISGLEVLKTLRETHSINQLPVIMVTGKSQSEDIVAALNLGANDYVTKPLDFPVALARIQTQLSLKRAEEALRKASEELEMRVEERTAELLKSNEALQSEIADRKRIQEALRASEDRYRDLIENANDIIYTHDLEGNLLSVNKAGELAIGYKRDEFLEMNIAQWVDPSQQESVRKLVRQQVERREPRASYQLAVMTREGRELTMDVSARLIYREGKPIAVEGIARDVTDRIILEERLRQSQKMEAVGRLAGGIAHDFNNLLTAITGYSELLLSHADDLGPLRKYIDEILRAGRSSESLTRQLLAFSRRQVLQPRVLDLNTVVGNIHKMLRRLIGEDIELVTVFGSELGRMKADPGQLQQVILNLAVNARDAMPQGGKLVIETGDIELDDEVAHRRATKPGHYVRLAVGDTGYGMDAETISHIFEPFYTTKEQGKGTGLGLSTVYGIVKQSGGSIWVDSQPGQGTNFQICFPQVDEELEVVEPAKSISRAAGGTETVLLVEDEELVRNLVRDILRKNGYFVLEAHHGTEALRVALQHKGPIHLLLTDVVMPQMGGRVLAERLKTFRPGIRILYISGYVDDATIQEGVSNPGTSFLQKPFTVETLSRKVRELLDS